MFFIIYFGCANFPILTRLMLYHPRENKAMMMMMMMMMSTEGVLSVVVE